MNHLCIHVFLYNIQVCFQGNDTMSEDSYHVDGTEEGEHVVKR
jgi:hypothetical protein